MFRKQYLLLAILIALALLSARPSQAAPESLPDFAFIEGLTARGQTYPLSCESRSASDLAGYWGVDAPEVEFFENLPVSDNPNKGFVGSVFGTWGQTPPKPYGVHAKPVAKLLQSYGLDAKARQGMTMDELKREIANGRPVIVWVVGHVWQGTPVEYTAKDGEVVTVAAYEHTMLAYGYDHSGIYLIDAGNAARNVYSYKIFKQSWGVLGNMAVTATGDREVTVRKPEDSSGEETNPNDGTNTNPGSSPGGTYIVQPGDHLSALAREWGISWQDLAKLNSIGFPYTIYPGQVLLTGSGGQSNPPQPTAAPTKTPAPTKKPANTPAPSAVPTDPPPTPTPTPEKQQALSSGKSGMKIEAEGGGQDLENTYTVLKGEHLMQIARKLQLSWTAIAELNGLSAPYSLVPGQVLDLPGPEAGPPPPPLPGSESESAANRNVHIVQTGEYLYVIARQLGINWHTLAALNKIAPPYIVNPGQEIKLP